MYSHLWYSFSFGLFIPPVYVHVLGLDFSLICIEVFALFITGKRMVVQLPGMGVVLVYLAASIVALIKTKIIKLG